MVQGLHFAPPSTFFLLSNREGKLSLVSRCNDAIPFDWLLFTYGEAAFFPPPPGTFAFIIADTYQSVVRVS
jgi:hypothetical protein